MAVDTETKRRGVPNIPPLTHPPVPDGAISNVDRMQITGWYAGITPGAAVSQIDTENKRRGVYNIPPFTSHPVADGTVSNADRMQVSGWYAGIIPGAPADGNAPTGVFYGPFMGPFGGPI